MPKKTLDPERPIESLLEITGMPGAELARRMRIAQPSVPNAVARGSGIRLDWLLRAADAVGLTIEISIKKKT